VLRLLSLLLACALTAGLLLLPAMRGRELSASGHALLTPLVIVVCGLLVHGLGMRFESRWARVLVHPALLWPLAIALSALWWLRS
jgi:predicted membrane protein